MQTIFILNMYKSELVKRYISISRADIFPSLYNKIKVSFIKDYIYSQTVISRFESK